MGLLSVGTIRSLIGIECIAALKTRRSRELRNYDEWIEFTKSGDLPPDIPVAPWQTYKDKGWKGIGDWLGTGTVKKGKEQFLPFKKARAHARSLRLKSQAGWKAYCKSGKKPKNIPAHPEIAFATAGWVDWGDWLGTNVIAIQARQYREFPTSAKRLVRCHVGHAGCASCRPARRLSILPNKERPKTNSL